MRSTRLLITVAIWAFVPGLHANDSAHCSDDGVLLRFQDDLMIQVDDGFEGLRVTTPGAASAALAAEWCAARPSIATSECALALADAVDEVRLHHYYSDAIGALQAHLERDGHDLRAMEGHTGAWFRKVRAIRRLASRPGVRTVVEIGFNAGHSALNFLTSSGSLRVVAFDLGGHAYTASAARFLYDAFPGRFTLIVGPSNASLPTFASLAPDVRADVLWIDGDHTPRGLRSDLDNARKMAAPGHRVLLDDLASEGRPAHPEQRGISVIWAEEVARGGVRELERVPDDFCDCRLSPVQPFVLPSGAKPLAEALDDDPPFALYRARRRVMVNDEIIANATDAEWPRCCGEKDPSSKRVWMWGDLVVGEYI